MAYQRISKEEFMKLSQEERDYLTLEFNKSEQNRKWWTLIITRSIAVVFIISLFFMGYVQLQSVKNYNEKIDTYGTQAFCALCGEYSLKKCECQYATMYNAGSNKPNDINVTKIGIELSEYNVQQCESFEVYREDRVKEILNWSLINVTQ